MKPKNTDKANISLQTRSSVGHLMPAPQLIRPYLSQTFYYYHKHCFCASSAAKADTAVAAAAKAAAAAAAVVAAATAVAPAGETPMSKLVIILQERKILFLVNFVIF